MASEQLRRENVSDETVVEKDRVPKMTTRFESLTEKAREDQLHHVPHVERREEISKKETRGADCGGQGRQGPSLEELSDVRVMAKQNSMAAAEEQYEKAEEMCVSKAKSAAKYVLESGRGAAEYVGKVAAAVKDQAVEVGRETAYYTRVAVADATTAVAEVSSSVGEKAAVVKDKVVDTGKTAVGYAGAKIAAAKDAVVGSEEKGAAFAERKKVEAQKDLEGKRAS